MSNSTQVYQAIFSVITSEKPQSLSKKYELINGNVNKSVCANLYEGSAAYCSVNSVEQFGRKLTSLKTNQALCYGIPKEDNCRLTTKANLSNSPHEYARSKEHFSWPLSGGVLMLDYDPQESHVKSREELYEILYDEFPALRNAGSVWWASSSSFIFNGDEQIAGLRGQRIYFLLKDAQDIERAGKIIIDRLWLKGFGYFAVSRSGQMLERTIFDACVWQSSRFDFASGAECVSPLRQNRGQPIINSGEFVDSHAVFLDLTPAEVRAVEQIKVSLRREKQAHASLVKDQYIEQKAKALTENNKYPDIRDAEDTVKRALAFKVLHGNFIITLHDNTEVTISEILASPEKFHNVTTKDPLEPEYDNYKNVGILYVLRGSPILVSQARGQKVYSLLQQPQFIELVKGRTYDAMNQVLIVLREQPNVFDKDHMLVKVENGREIPITDPPALSYFMSSLIQFYSVDHRSKNNQKVLKDPPDNILKQILSLGSERKLKPLVSVINNSLVRLDGSVLSKPGYDESSRLFVDLNVEANSISSFSVRGLEQSLNTIFEAFNSFPFIDTTDRSVLLAAVFTAVQRPIIETAPAIGFDAPVQGSGKTLLAKSIGAICTGKNCAVWPDIGSNEEEIRKRLFTILKQGDRVGVWDNILGVFNSKSLASLLTSESYQDRLLGQSNQLSLPNRLFLILTGNNLTLSGDMVRRVLKCRIDPQTDRPYAREFYIDPVSFVISNRNKIIESVINIILAHRNSGERVPGRMASFEQWDDMVRQPIAWLSRVLPEAGLCDPMKAIDEAQKNDPEKLALGDVLAKIFVCLGNKPFSSKELFKFIDLPEYNPHSLSAEWMDLTGEKGNTRSIGRQLGYRKNRIVDGLQLICCGKDRSTKVQLWQVQEVKQAS